MISHLNHVYLNLMAAAAAAADGDGDDDDAVIASLVQQKIPVVLHYLHFFPDLLFLPAYERSVGAGLTIELKNLHAHLI